MCCDVPCVQETNTVVSHLPRHPTLPSLGETVDRRLLCADISAHQEAIGIFLRDLYL